MPRRSSKLRERGCAPGSGFAHGQRPNEGQSPTRKTAASGEAEPRLTSGRRSRCGLYEKQQNAELLPDVSDTRALDRQPQVAHEQKLNAGLLTDISIREHSVHNHRFALDDGGFKARIPCRLQRSGNQKRRALAHVLRADHTSCLIDSYLHNHDSRCSSSSRFGGILRLWQPQRSRIQIRVRRFG